MGLRSFKQFAFGVALAGLMLFVSPVEAAITYTVTTAVDADCSVGTGGSAGDLQACLTEAEGDGDNSILTIADGLYDASGGEFFYDTTENKTLTLNGSTTGDTILDGGGFRRVLRVETIDVGVDADTAANISINNIIFKGGDSGGGDGGGLLLTTEAADVAISDCDFNRNVADDSGGADISTTLGDVTIQDSTFFANMSDDDQGALRVAATNGGNISLTNNTFRNNFASDPINGPLNGAAELIANPGNITVDNNQFLNNVAFGSNGALTINCGGSGVCTVKNSTFEGNAAVDSHRGALHANASLGDLIIDNNEFLNNVAGRDDGAAELFSAGTVLITNNIVSGNRAGRDGSGISAGSSSGEILVINNTFHDNIAGVGGGIFGDGGALTIFLTEFPATASIFNNIFFNNAASGDGDDIMAIDDNAGTGSTVTLSNNNFAEFFSECANTGGCTPAVTESNTTNVDPLFADAANGDFHLLFGSPAIDAGTAAAPSLPATDFEGDARTIGAAPDLGADETLAPTCGDGIVQAPEACDDAGESATCNADCTAASCGDGVTNATASEACDDANTTAGDGCSDTCESEACGNGVLDAGEECEDGNTTSGDGCDSSCQFDAGAGGGGDTDGDGVANDGDGSGAIDDNPCTGGETTGCDDNCPNVDNADQADEDEDGIGDACDLDSVDTGGCSLIR